MKLEHKLRLRSFLDGIGSTLELLPPMRDEDEDALGPMKSPKSDAEAIAEDWNATGNDLEKAINFQFVSQTKLEQEITVGPQQIDPQMKLW
jgi:hypothetical protein